MHVRLSTITALASQVSFAFGGSTPHSPSLPISYETITGFFKQDLPETDPATFDYIAENFGLLNKFSPSRKLEPAIHGNNNDGEGEEENEEEEESPPWKRFEKTVRKLNRRAPRGTRYAVMFLARHGQGYHNVAEEFYGTEMWDCYWSLLEGNGTSIWDDAELTGVGITEAKKANAAWKAQLKMGAPLPESYYTSPLSRSATTLDITWKDIVLDREPRKVPVIKEEFRETLGIHTCDRRKSKSALAKKYPRSTFERGFTEKDELWLPDLREPNEARNVRVKKGLDEVFQNDDSTFITISAHGGAITSVLEIIGHRKFSLRTGAMIPVVVKVEYGERPTPPGPIPPSGTAPDCPSTATA